MSNEAAALNATADVTRITGLDKARLSKLDKSGILKPTQPGAQGAGNVRRYGPNKVAAGLILRDLSKLGIDAVAAAPIIRLVTELDGWDKQPRRAGDNSVQLVFADFPRWVLADTINGCTTSYNLYETHAGLHVDVHFYVAQVVIFGELQTKPPNLRLRCLYGDFEKSSEKPIAQAARGLWGQITGGGISPSEAAALLDVPEDVIYSEVRYYRLREFHEMSRSYERMMREEAEDDGDTEGQTEIEISLAEEDRDGRRNWLLEYQDLREFYEKDQLRQKAEGRMEDS